MKYKFYYFCYQMLISISDKYDLRSLRKLKIMVGSSLVLLMNSQSLFSQTKAPDFIENSLPQQPDSIKTPDIPPPSEEEEIFCYIIEQMPEYPGGNSALMNFIRENLVYPPEARDIEGRVIVQFTIEKDGTIVNIKTLRSIHPALDHAAMDVIRKMPSWVPGRQRNNPVSVSYTLPVNFKKPE